MSGEPRRTCLGCRTVRSKSALLRLVRCADGRVVADPNGRAIGRGAYVCPDAECMARALSRGRLTHAFRAPCEAGSDLAAAATPAGRRRVVAGRAYPGIASSARNTIDAAVRA